MPVILNSDLVPAELRRVVEEIVRHHYHQPLEIQWQDRDSGEALLHLPPGLIGAKAAEWEVIGDSSRPETDATQLMAALIDREILDLLERELPAAARGQGS